MSFFLGAGAASISSNEWSVFGTPIASFLADNSITSESNVIILPDDINGFNLSNLSNYPSYNATGWNNTLPTVDFNGVNQYLFESTALGGNFNGDDVPYNIVIAAYIPASSQYFVNFGNSENASPYASAIQYHGTSLRSERRGNSGGASTAISEEPPPTGKHHIILVNFHGTTVDAFIKTEDDMGYRQILNEATLNSAASTFNRFCLGALLRTSAGFFWNGKLRVCTVFSSLEDQEGLLEYVETLAPLS